MQKKVLKSCQTFNATPFLVLIRALHSFLCTRSLLFNSEFPDFDLNSFWYCTKFEHCFWMRSMQLFWTWAKTHKRVCFLPNTVFLVSPVNRMTWLLSRTGRKRSSIEGNNCVSGKMRPRSISQFFILKKAQTLGHPGNSAVFLKHGSAFPPHVSIGYLLPSPMYFPIIVLCLEKRSISFPSPLRWLSRFSYLEILARYLPLFIRIFFIFYFLL